MLPQIRYLIALIFGILFFQNAYAEDSLKLKVGFILPLSGQGAAIGEAAKNAVTLAQEDMSEHIRNKIEFIFDDDTLDPKTSLTIFNRLVATQKISAAYVIGSGAGNSVGPVAEKNKVPLLAIASDPKVAANRSFVMNLWVTPEEEVRAFYIEAKKRAYKQIARYTVTHEGAIAVKQVMDAQNDGSIIFNPDEEIPPDLNDFRTIIAKLKGAKQTNAVAPILFPSQLITFTKTARQNGVKSPFAGYEFFEDPSVIKGTEGGLIGSWYINGDDGDLKFIERYKHRFPGSSIYAIANAYDAAMMIATAISKDPSSAGINNYLHQLKDYTGMLGTFSSTSDNRFTLKAVIKEITASGAKTIG